MTTSTDRPLSPTAARIRRPTWRDPRLLLGLVIVAGSVALGSWAVSSAGRTVAVYAAAGALTPGETFAMDQLRTIEVRLGTESERYFRADEPLPEGSVALRVVEDGELVPRSAVGDPADLTVRSVAIPVTSGLSDRITDGAAVDVWFVPAAAAGSKDGEPAEPRQLASGVTVAQVDDQGGTLVVGGPTTIHTLIPTEELPTVLGALSAEGTIAVVPVAGGTA